MQELIAKEREPITPFIDKVRHLYDEYQVSTILVMGGSGDYFDVADTVIAMDAYAPHDVTDQARAQVERHQAVGQPQRRLDRLGDTVSRGVVVEGPVYNRRLARLRVFRYEVRRWANGVIPDAGEAVRGPQRLSTDQGTARRLLDVVPSVPVMVCMDGFILTHAYERVDLPSQSEIDRYLPAFSPRQILDPQQPVTIGAMVGPEAFTEVRYLAHYRQMQALWMIPELAEDFEEQFGRASGGLIHEYRTEGARTLVVALGSVNGTIKDVIDELREEELPIGSVSICSFRPFPMKALKSALEDARRVVVIEKSLAVGIGGIVSTDVRMALAGLDIPVYTVVAGLGGRAITRASLREAFVRAGKNALQRLTFLDLNHDVIHAEIERLESTRLSGPIAENILRELGVVADHIG
mgnify:CR=1 FL=1